MQNVIDTYQCEWATVVNDPEKRKLFRQFVNTDECESTIEIISERGQNRPADWVSEETSLYQIEELKSRRLDDNDAQQLNDTRWVPVGHVDDFPYDGGATIKYGKTQIAVFNFATRGEWYACQQMCPHKKAFVLSRGIIGDTGGVPKVACPLHKKTFALESGECLSGEDYEVETFPVKVEGGDVLLELPPSEVLDKRHATEIGCRLATTCHSNGHAGDLAEAAGVSV